MLPGMPVIADWNQPSAREWLLALLFSLPAWIWWLWRIGQARLPQQRGVSGGFWGAANRRVQGSALIGKGRYATWAEHLRWAGLPFRPAELYCCALGGFMLGALLGYWLLGLLLMALLAGVGLALLPFLEVRRRALAGRRQLVRQAARLCSSLAGQIENNATLTMLFAFAAQAGPPLGPLFAQVLGESQSGRSDRAALEALQERQVHPALLRIVDPLLLLITTGGNVTPLLRAAADDLRKEEQRRMQLEVRLAQARYQFWIVLFLVVPLLVVLHWGTPGTVTLFLSFPYVLYFLLLLALCFLIYGLVVLPRTRVESLYRQLERD